MKLKRRRGSGTLDQLRPPPADLMVTTQRVTQALDIIERAAVAARLHVAALDARGQQTREAAQVAVLSQLTQASGALHVLIWGRQSWAAQRWARGEEVV